MSNYKGQHKIGQVYLKQFAHVQFEKVNVCVWKKGENFTERKSVKTFTKEDYVFDIVSFGNEDKGIFEKLNGMLETDYPKIITEIEKTGKLSSTNELLLFQFIANLLCRTSNFRNRINDLYFDSSTREKLLKEITMFSAATRITAIQKVKNMPDKDAVNTISVFVMEHLLKCFTNFNYCILKEYNERGWVTSDNPVVIEYNEVFDAIISPETEIYFPISRHYCLYMFHINSRKKSNKLINLTNKKLVEITEDIQEFIFHKISDNADEFVIFPWDLGRTNLSSKTENTLKE